MNQHDKIYHDLCYDILNNGTVKSDRTGTGTISIFGRMLEFDMKNGFPLLTTKKLHWKSIVTELLWFLSGETNIKPLLEQGNTIWVGDALKRYNRCEIAEGNKYLEENPGDFINVRLTSREDFIEKIKTNPSFAGQWGDLGPIYGKQWRAWDTNKYASKFRGVELGKIIIDQISDLISAIKNNPDSRRLMVTAWNPGQISEQILPPCHYGFQIYTKELTHYERFKYYTRDCNTGLTQINFTPEQFDELNVPKRYISLLWQQRSVDTFLGLPFNIASYGLLLHLIAAEVDMVPDKLQCSLGDTHIYLNHIDYVKELLTRDSKSNPPALELKTVKDIFSYTLDDIILNNYDAHPNWKDVPLSN